VEANLRNCVTAIRQSIHGYRKSRKRRLTTGGEKDFFSVKHEIGSKSIPPTDAAMNFYLRICLLGNYDTVFEIGCTHGQRIIELKTLLPKLQAIGCDVAPVFNNKFTDFGVNFGKYDPAIFDDFQFEKGVLLSRGTMAYMNQSAISAFSSLNFG